MKTFLFKSSAIFMAFLVLFSTVSFSMDMHFCGDTLVDYSFFDDSADCGMKLMSTDDQKCPMSLMNCCTDHEISQDGQDEMAISWNSLDLEQQQFILALSYSYIDFYTSLPKQTIPFSQYSPPLLTYDRQLVWETFLI